jgi:hypothetical protein
MYDDFQVLRFEAQLKDFLYVYLQLVQRSSLTMSAGNTGNHSKVQLGFLVRFYITGAA